MSQCHRFKSWKIMLLSTGQWEAVRIKPTEYFIATSLRAAMSAISRREREREKVRGKAVDTQSKTASCQSSSKHNDF